MRIGLVAALRRSEEGTLCAELLLAGQSVLAWQVALLHSLGVERVLCLTEQLEGALLDLQHPLEACGAEFHALNSITALPALVRAEDNLVIIADGVVPDPVVATGLFRGEGALQRAVITLSADHALAVAHPEVFERIDSINHWAGVLAMHGEPVQQLAEFPDDADAISLLLRIALQTGTPRRALVARDLMPDCWLLARNAASVEKYESSLIARAAPVIDTRAPLKALAALVVRALVPEGLANGALIAGVLALALLLGGVAAAAFDQAVLGLVAAVFGAFAVEVFLGFGVFSARLGYHMGPPRGHAIAGAVGDALAAFVAWFSLSPVDGWQPLALLGPVTVGLARLAGRDSEGWAGALAKDRASLLLVLAIAAAFGLLAEMTACLAVGLLAALLLRTKGR